MPTPLYKADLSQWPTFDGLTDNMRYQDWGKSTRDCYLGTANCYLCGQIGFCFCPNCVTKDSIAGKDLIAVYGELPRPNMNWRPGDEGITCTSCRRAKDRTVA